MSIASELSILSDCRDAIATAITNKGGTVNQGDGFADFATDIATIPSGAKVKYFSVALTDSTKKLPVDITEGVTDYFSLDFEPKGVLYINENSAQLVRQHLPTITGKTVRGYTFGCSFPSTFAEGMQSAVKRRSYVTLSEASDSALVSMVSSEIPFSCTYNSVTGKYDTIIGTTAAETTSFVYRFVGWSGASPSHVLFFG